MNPSLAASALISRTRVRRLLRVTQLMLPWLALLWVAGCASGIPQAAESAVVTTSERTSGMVVTASVLVTDEVPAPLLDIDSIQLSPAAIVADIGEAISLTAVAVGPSGEPIDGVKFSWAVLNPRAGTIDDTGVFRGGNHPGSYLDAITVTTFWNTPAGIRLVDGAASVTIVGEPPATTLGSMAIVPPNATALSGQIYRFHAVALDPVGNVIPNVSFVWNLADASLGSLNSAGYLAVAGHPGSYQDSIIVTGILNGEKVTATASMTVVSTPKADDYFDVQILPRRFFLDPGDRIKLEAVALNGLGEIITGTQIRWSMIDPQAGIVDGTGMFVAGLNPGIYTEAVQVEAIVLGEQGSVRAVDVASVVIHQIEEVSRLQFSWVTPNSPVVREGSRILFVPRAVDQTGAPVADVLFTWEVTKTEAGTIDEHGVFTTTGPPGAYPGALVVTAVQELDGETVRRATEVDIVIVGSLVGASIAPALAEVAPSKTIHFSVTGNDENGVELDGLIVRWTVADETVGSIDLFGNFTAGVAPGLYENVIRAELVESAAR